MGVRVKKRKGERGKGSVRESECGRGALRSPRSSRTGRRPQAILWVFRPDPWTADRDDRP
jgi:hypothetical protein